MRCEALAVFLSSMTISLNAMQSELSTSEEYSVTFQIQMPLPKQKVTEKQIDLKNEQSVIDYLSTLQSQNDIPISMYNVMIDKANNNISEEFSDILLRLWGINPDILVSGKKEIIEAIRATLLDVKNTIEKKQEENYEKNSFI